jgi:hypothetical protein
MSSASDNAYSRMVADVLCDGAAEFRDVSFGYEAGLGVLKGWSVGRRPALLCKVFVVATGCCASFVLVKQVTVIRQDSAC